MLKLASNRGCCVGSLTPTIYWPKSFNWVLFHRQCFAYVKFSLLDDFLTYFLAMLQMLQKSSSFFTCAKVLLIERSVNFRNLITESRWFYSPPIASNRVEGTWSRQLKVLIVTMNYYYENSIENWTHGHSRHQSHWRKKLHWCHLEKSRTFYSSNYSL